MHDLGQVTSLSLGFVICKVGTILPTFHGCLQAWYSAHTVGAHSLVITFILVVVPMLLEQPPNVILVLLPFFPLFLSFSARMPRDVVIKDGGGNWMVGVIWGDCMEKMKAILAQTSPEPLCLYIFIICTLPSSKMEYEVVYIVTLFRYNNSVLKILMLYQITMLYTWN